MSGWAGRTSTAVRVLACVVGLAGCTPPGGPLGDLLDTGWFGDSDGDVCAARVGSTTPVDGAVDWSWRARPVVLVDQVSDVFAARLTTAGGVEVPTSLVPDATGLALTVAFDGALAADTDYVLEITDCAGPTTVHFRTSRLGTPVAGGPASLRGRTWQLDAVNATWVEPGGLGSFLAANFDLPILVGAVFADDTTLKLIGGLGAVVDGDVVQGDAPTWDFPSRPFDESPWFRTESDEIVLDIAGLPLPVYDFRLEGTFLADGSGFGDGVLSGLADTRLAGGAFGAEGDPDAVCGYAEAIGVSCVACPDSLETCLVVELRDLTASEVEGLALVPVAAKAE